jgi:hypothetical protein
MHEWFITVRVLFVKLLPVLVSLTMSYCQSSSKAALKVAEGERD